MCVANALNEIGEPRWQRLIECPVLLDTGHIVNSELVDSFVAEICGLTEVVFVGLP